MYTEGQLILKLFEDARTIRNTYESGWRRIAERILPRDTQRFFSSPATPFRTTHRNINVDTKGKDALVKFGSICNSLITPSNYTYQKLAASDARLMKIKRVADYWQEATNCLWKYRYEARAGFIMAMAENYVALGAYGTRFTFVSKPKDGARGLRYRAMHVTQIYALIDENNWIDRVFRRIELNARQAVQMFGEDRLPDKLLTEYRKPGGPSETSMFAFIHYVCKNDKIDRTFADDRGMEFKSCYVSEDSKEIVKQEGFNTWPFPGSRYWTTAGEIWGESPAEWAHGAINARNAMKTSVIRQGQRATEPVLLGPDDGVLDGFDITPGTMNPGAITRDGRKLVDTLPVGDVQAGVEIEQHFLVDLYKLVLENPNMTATQVMEVAATRGTFLEPVLGRQNTEFMDPLTERELDLLAEQGLLPEMPPELREAQGEYNITFDNPIMRAARSNEVSGFMRTVEMATNAASATGDTTIMNAFAFKRAVPEIAQIQNVPSNWMNSPEEIAALETATQQQAEISTAIEAAPAVAGLMKAGVAAGNTAKGMSRAA